MKKKSCIALLVAGIVLSLLGAHIWKIVRPLARLV